MNQNNNFDGIVKIIRFLDLANFCVSIRKLRYQDNKISLPSLPNCCQRRVSCFDDRLLVLKSDMTANLTITILNSPTALPTSMIQSTRACVGDTIVVKLIKQGALYPTHCYDVELTVDKAEHDNPIYPKPTAPKKDAKGRDDNKFIFRAYLSDHCCRRTILRSVFGQLGSAQ